MTPFLIAAGALIVVVALVLVLARARSPKVVKVTDHELFDVLWLWPEGAHTRWGGRGTNRLPGAEPEDLVPRR